MARVQNTLIGKSSGSIGGVTLSTWKGINVAKSKPVSVANPNTAGQQLARAKMSNAVAIFRMIATLVAVGFSQMAHKMSAYNAFVAENLKNGSLTGAILDKIGMPALFEISKGTLTDTAVISVQTNPGTLQWDIEWNHDVIGDQSTTDKAYSLLTTNDGRIIGQQLGSSERQDGLSGGVATEPLIAGQTYHAYLFFYQESSRKVSDSIHYSFVV